METGSRFAHILEKGSQKFIKSSQVKLPLIKTRDNRTSITCRNGNKISKMSNIKFKKQNKKTYVI